MWPDTAAPLAGLGIGQQLQRLARMREQPAPRLPAQPVQAAFASAPLYDLPDDYRQDLRPFTVNLAGPRAELARDKVRRAAARRGCG